MRQLALISHRRTHVAIMRKSWGLAEKIISGEKTIESRWYLNKSAPWDEINEGDLIYFKNAGEPIRLRAEVAMLTQFEDLSPKEVRQILFEFGDQNGLDVGKLENYYEIFKDKRYCILIFLKNIEKVEPFEIEKKGFGTMSAWIVLDDIEKIKRINAPVFRQTSLLRKK